MAAPSGAGARRLWAGLVPVLLLFAAAEEGPSTAEFDVRPGGMVHSFSRSLQWQMSIGVSEDDKLFSCSVWRPQGKSYLFFTQFKAEVKGAKIEYGMAYSQAATGGQSDVPLKAEEFEITETTVAHKEGKFRSELSKLVIVAKTPHDEL
ncbi:UPF0556 protein C19orf10 like protein [Chelonia mydas]|uniref:UPF0556 protein C19orf10 like protein n=1 Tax=Chelonia mydas TaxID=8469 RepID=M7AIN7_CHEMY|nr:UPF0556 protein C19orf10 like protein [Chelonia mydas]